MKVCNGHGHVEHDGRWVTVHTGHYHVQKSENKEV